MKLRKLGLSILLCSAGSYSLYCNEKTKSYIWGNGVYQALPGQGLSFNNFIPKQLVDFDDKNLQKLFLSEQFESGITGNGDGYIWTAHKLSSQEDKNINDGKRQNITKINVPKGKIKQIKYTKQFVWALTNNGDVFQYQVKDGQFINTPKKINSLQNINQIECGEDHFVALTNDGSILTMGDDTYGQCGLGSNNRSTAPPFYEQRIRNPTKIENLPKINKIICGSNHTLCISAEGSVYGWGSNSQMQLSHSEEFSRVGEPLIAVYNPLRISALMDSNNQVLDLAAGNEFSVFVTKNKQNSETEVFACGHNIRGQLGCGFVRHISDIVKLEGLSNFKININGKQENVEVKQIECGYNHCMALTNVGAILEWGDNEYGQLGNKKRSFTDKPIVVSQFVQNRVATISCGSNSSGVIIQQ
ncbi:unnamed protein product [Paramecium primaurelia]|uniref:RCC1-like domain-containing protein n=1 Tax=Paramecium primaurelia TaxID=5886 RepID=A0A8S1MAF5_PARPR|nr:unnamed protein product [Paramecium primaurelia]